MLTTLSSTAHLPAEMGANTPYYWTKREYCNVYLFANSYVTILETFCSIFLTVLTVRQNREVLPLFIFSVTTVGNFLFTNLNCLKKVKFSIFPKLDTILKKVIILMTTKRILSKFNFQNIDRFFCENFLIYFQFCKC